MLLYETKINKEELTNDQARALIEPFYDLFRSKKRDWDKGMAVLDDNWKAYFTNSNFRGKTDTRKFLQGFFDLIPDINVEIKDLNVDGDTISVRSELSGTPAKDFLVPYSGRSFHIMTVDINRVRNGKLVELYHCEDWETARKQLSGEEV